MILQKTHQQDLRPVPGYPGFLASSCGQIFSEKSGIFKKQSSNKDGYKTILVWERGKDRYKKVHQFVALAFHGLPPSDRHTVDHINRDCGDNRAENLRWACPVVQAVNRDDFVSVQKRAKTIAREIELLSMHCDFQNVFSDGEMSILEKAMAVLTMKADQ